LLNLDSRKIIHIDCDCFFAAVELRDNPQWRGLPLAVGGRAASRGVLSTCNYEAREFGLHSAMPTAEALRLCPQLVLVPHRFAAYKEASQQILHILREYTDAVEPLSLDEAFLDVSDSDNASLLAQTIRQQIAKQVGITASAGVSINKFLAKVASDIRKPNGQFVIAPARVAEFLHDLPVQRIPGVGKASMLKMQQLQIVSCADLQQVPLHQLINHFGVFGKRLYGYARGIDYRPVRTDRVRKSLSVEHTFAENLQNPEQCEEAVRSLAEQLQQRWQPLKKDYSINKVFLKIRFADFSLMSMENKATGFNEPMLQQLLQQLMQRKTMQVRLLGVGVGLQERKEEQLDLFDHHSHH